MPPFLGIHPIPPPQCYGEVPIGLADDPLSLSPATAGPRGIILGCRKEGTRQHGLRVWGRRSEGGGQGGQRKRRKQGHRPNPGF